MCLLECLRRNGSTRTLLKEAEREEFTPLTGKEMLIELKVFVEHLTCDCYFNTHHISGIHLSGPDYLKRKDKIIKALEQEIEHGDTIKNEVARRDRTGHRNLTYMRGIFRPRGLEVPFSMSLQHMNELSTSMENVRMRLSYRSEIKCKENFAKPLDK